MQRCRPLRSGATSAIWSVVVGLFLSACGPGEVEPEPETWMLGTFSGGGIPPAIPGCSPSGRVTRYEFHADGQVDITSDSYVSSGSFDYEFKAKWEQHAPGRIRVMRDEEHADVEFYPILKGTEWEITQSSECDPDSMLWHEIDEIVLADGERYMLDQMTPGALCTSAAEDGQCGVVESGFVVFWCDAAPPPNSCD